MKRALIALSVLLAGCAAAPTRPPPTATPALSPTPYTCSCQNDLYKCDSFRSSREAQACFDYCMDHTGADVHRLDSDGDGRVCES